MKKVLFIGGPANISGHCATALTEMGFDVSIFTRSLSRDDAGAAPKCRLYYGDRMDADSLSVVVREVKPDAVVDFCCFKPAELKPALHALPGTLAQYIFISTVDVYGYPLSHLPMRESDPLRAPNCRYAADKRACEQMLRQSTFSPIVTIARPSYSMGPRFAITALTRNGGKTLVPRLRAGLPVLSPDDGQRLLHAGTAGDAGRMIAQMVLASRCLGQDYTVASPAAITYDQYLGLFAEALNVKPNIIHVPTEKIYELSDYTIYEENLLYDLTSHHISFSVDKFRSHFPNFEWTCPVGEAVKEFIAFQDAHGGFACDTDRAESAVLARWKA
jgi:nucleoside-diphosphate-sugar epimerase